VINYPALYFRNRLFTTFFLFLHQSWHMISFPSLKGTLPMVRAYAGH
jgi:hypothetical protein